MHEILPGFIFCAPAIVGVGRNPSSAPNRAGQVVEEVSAAWMPPSNPQVGVCGVSCNELPETRIQAELDAVDDAIRG